MKKVAVIVEEGFEDSEFAEPVKALKEAGFQVTIIGPEANRDYKGKRGQATARTDKSFEEVKPADFDALMIPGGQAPEKLRLHPPATPFVKAFGEAGKPIAAICHGPQLLISADLLKGKKATCYEAIAVDVKNAGARYQDAPVVVDGTLVTSRKPADLPQFCQAMVQLFQGEKIRT